MLYELKIVTCVVCILKQINIGMIRRRKFETYFLELNKPSSQLSRNMWMLLFSFDPRLSVIVTCIMKTTLTLLYLLQASELRKVGTQSVSIVPFMCICNITWNSESYSLGTWPCHCVAEVNKCAKQDWVVSNKNLR